MNKKIPMRQCIGCGEMKSKKEMMRVLKTAEGTITLDMTGKKKWKRRISLYFRGMPGKGKEKQRYGAFFQDEHSNTGL